MSIAPDAPKELIWLGGRVRTPPFSIEARREMGQLLRQVQEGQMVGMPHSRPMPSIGRGVHELRVRDEDRNWRLIYRVGGNRIVVVEVFEKTTRATPRHVIATCRQRLRVYDG